MNKNTQKRIVAVILSVTLVNSLCNAYKKNLKENVKYEKPYSLGMTMVGECLSNEPKMKVNSLTRGRRRKSFYRKSTREFDKFDSSDLM